MEARIQNTQLLVEDRSSNAPTSTNSIYSPAHHALATEQSKGTLNPIYTHAASTELTRTIPGAFSRFLSPIAGVTALGGVMSFAFGESAFGWTCLALCAAGTLAAKVSK